VAAIEVVRDLADIGPVAIWFGVAMIGLVVVFTGYVGVALVAALKASTPEQQKYRSGLLCELLRFLRELFRGRGKR
jgi:hypothetical protein